MLQQGYSFNVLTGRFGFSDTTVRQEMRKLIPPDEGPLAVDNSKDDGRLPMTVKATEIITPEAVLQRYAEGDDMAQAELRGVMKFRAAMLMVMDLMRVAEARSEAQAKAMEPFLKMMQETRSEMDAAALRARASVDEAASKAADGTAAKVADFLAPRLEALEQKKPDIASTANPMAGMMARSMETLMDRLLSGMGFGGQPGQGQPAAPTGFTYKKQKEGEGNG